MTDRTCRRAQIQLFVLRRLSSLNICRKLLQMLCPTTVTACIMKTDATHLDKLVRKAGSDLSAELDGQAQSCQTQILDTF